MTPENAAALRKPFPASAIGKLPKGGTMLDYCGHAAVTDRLLMADPDWCWEPFAVDEQGLPAYQNGCLWIRLTVCGVTRIGVGDGPDPKQRIGDAIRNAAMRFGVALDLWSRQELEGVDPNGGDSAAPAPRQPSRPEPSPAPTSSPAPVTEPAVSGSDSGSSSPEAAVVALRGRVVEAMGLDRREATKVLARLQAEIVKAKLAGAMTTTPADKPTSLGGLVDQAIDFVTKAPIGGHGNAHADAQAGAA